MGEDVDAEHESSSDEAVDCDDDEVEYSSYRREMRLGAAGVGVGGVDFGSQGSKSHAPGASGHDDAVSNTSASSRYEGV